MLSIMQSARQASSVTSPISDPVEIVLEDVLLKQGSRSQQFWHERYFTISSDYTLRYYNHKDDPSPKGAYHIPTLPDCQVSDLFVAKHQKQLIYCVKLTWSEAGMSNSAGGESAGALDTVHEDDTSTLMEVASRDNARVGLSADPSQDSIGSPVNDDEDKRQKSLKSPFQVFRRRKNAKTNGTDLRSVDRESLTHESRRKRVRLPSLEQREDVPNMVEVAERHSLPAPSTPQQSPPSTPNPTPSAGNSFHPNALMRTPRTPYERQRDEDLHYLQSQFLTLQNENRKRNKKRLVQGAKIALVTGAAIGLTIVTAGIGLVTGLVVLGGGAVAVGGGAAVELTWRRKASGEIVFATTDYEKARMWKACLDASKDSDSVLKSTWGQLFSSDGRKTNAALLPRKLSIPDEGNGSLRSLDNHELALLGQEDTKWQPLEGGWTSFLATASQGLRMFREERTGNFGSDSESTRGMHPVRRLFTMDASPCAPMKAHIVLNTSPLDAFLCLMSYGRIKVGQHLSPNSEQRASFRILECIDDHTDVIHLIFRPLYLFPSWTAPRDFVLFRYWRLEQDGSYVVCYESMEHASCPTVSGYVRGEMHQVVTIAPQKKSYRRMHPNASVGPPECFMTSVAQTDPKGWVPVTQVPFLSNQTYGDAFTVTLLSQMLEIRDAIDQDRFLTALHIPLDQEQQEYAQSFKPATAPELARMRSLDSTEGEELHDPSLNYDFAYSGRESVRYLNFASEMDIARNPPPLPAELWAEPDSNSFRVRGLHYLQDKIKINAGPSIGRLIATDIVLVDEPLYSGFSVHPTERIQMALRKEAAYRKMGSKKTAMPPFVFVVNVALPGPPFYHGVFYYAIDDMSTIDGSDGTPCSKLCSQFFFGDSDEFRDNTFKLIPQIVHGNFIVRKAVGSTPAIMGKKLRQLYVKGDRFFEVILDCGSSSVATGVIRLSLGYAKTLVIDMGFLFEANDESVLPERMFGCVRIKNPNFGLHLRKVEIPPAAPSM